jgi:hypothetical protein
MTGFRVNLEVQCRAQDMLQSGAMTAASLFLRNIGKQQRF